MNAHHCPVCGMVSTDSNITITHQGVNHFLCSQQCLENFNRQPHLYLGTHAEKHHRKCILKKRTLKLDSPLSKTEISSLESTLSAMMGVRNVEISGATVKVSYDLLEANVEQLEKVIGQEGHRLASRWINRLKRNWIHYTEETELDNLTAKESSCCNKAPAKKG